MTSSVVVTGMSGSGKSSLAFDTLYAEGQSALLASMSTFAKRFVGQLKKPDVDFVNGLSPVVSIDQKRVGSNPRSTVGTHDRHFGPPANALRDDGDAALSVVRRRRSSSARPIR